MAKRKCNADARLRKIKMTHQQELRQLKEEFGEQLVGLERVLSPLLYGQCFYHDALINLLTSPNEPDPDTLIGAVVFQRWIRNYGREVQQTLITYRTKHLN